MVKATRAYEHLGPRSGISDVRRLFRGINLGIISWELLRSGEASSRDLQWESIQSSKATSAPQRSSVGTLVDEGRAAVTGTVNSRRATMEYGRRVYPNEKIRMSWNTTWPCNCDNILAGHIQNNGSCAEWSFIETDEYWSKRVEKRV